MLSVKPSGDCEMLSVKDLAVTVKCSLLKT